MIRPLNINPTLHTADFRCDDCLNNATTVNLNTSLSYVGNSIIVEHSILSNPLCNGQYSSSSFPQKGPKLAQDLWAAKSS